MTSLVNSPTALRPGRTAPRAAARARASETPVQASPTVETLMLCDGLGVPLAALGRAVTREDGR